MEVKKFVFKIGQDILLPEGWTAFQVDEMGLTNRVAVWAWKFLPSTPYVTYSEWQGKEKTDFVVSAE